MSPRRSVHSLIANWSLLLHLSCQVVAHCLEADIFETYAILQVVPTDVAQHADSDSVAEPAPKLGQRLDFEKRTDLQPEPELSEVPSGTCAQLTKQEAQLKPSISKAQYSDPETALEATTHLNIDNSDEDEVQGPPALVDKQPVGLGNPRMPESATATDPFARLFLHSLDDELAGVSDEGEIHSQVSGPCSTMPLAPEQAAPDGDDSLQSSSAEEQALALLDSSEESASVTPGLELLTIDEPAAAVTPTPESPAFSKLDGDAGLLIKVSAEHYCIVSLCMRSCFKACKGSPSGIML